MFTKLAVAGARSILGFAAVAGMLFAGNAAHGTWADYLAADYIQLLGMGRGSERHHQCGNYDCAERLSR